MLLTKNPNKKGIIYGKQLLGDKYTKYKGRGDSHVEKLGKSLFITEKTLCGMCTQYRMEKRNCVNRKVMIYLKRKLLQDQNLRKEK